MELSDLIKKRSHRKEELLKVFKKEKIKVYLAGPIWQVEENQSYRKTLTDGLLAISPKFEIHDPWAREQKEFGGKGVHFGALMEDEEKKLVAEDIITSDLKDIYDCDLIIAYFFKVKGETTYTGTSCEIFWMYRILKKPVIVVYTKAFKKGAPLWVYGNSSIIFSNISNLFKWLKEELEENVNEEKKS